MWQVADDNDLKTARAGLLLAQTFLDGLKRLTSMREAADEYAVLQDLVITA